MKTAYRYIIAFLFVAGAQAQQAATPEPNQTQSQPCGAAPSSSKSTPKLTPKYQKWFDNHSPISSAELGKATTPSKPANPCPPAATPSPQLVPVLHLPTGIVTTWLCNPVVTAVDHTTSYVMPSDITEASPIQANTFLADSVKADARGVPCSSLHKDPITAKYWLAAK